MATESIDLGGIRVQILSGGNLRLDGGAMFGIIPRPLWSRATEPDDKHRVQLACNCLLIEWEGETNRRAIIEAGVGQKYAAKEQKIYAIDPDDWLGASLDAGGIARDSITDVLLTHLHFDHGGGLTEQVADDVRPTLPNARIHVQRQELEDALSSFGIMTSTYRDENLKPLEDRWQAVDGAFEMLPGLHALPTPGHTRGHVSLLVRGSERTLAFAGDVMPTAAHSGAAFNMAYDLFPLDNRVSKQKLLKQAAEEDWLLMLGHEPNQPLQRVVVDGDWYHLQPV